MKPTAPPVTWRLPRGPLFWRRYMGGQRQLWFLPFVVLKLARDHHAELLGRERANARAAAHSPFWSDLAVTSVSIGSRALLSRRYAPVSLEDYDAIADLMEERLELAARRPRGPALDLVRRASTLQSLPDALRRPAVAALRALELPVTGMHGDLHMFNFCRDGLDRFVLLDWEHYDGAGSFAIDYVDFHVANRFMSQRAKWPEFLAARRGPDAAAARAAERLGVAPRALWLAYLLLKIEVIATRAGGLASLPQAETFLDVLRNAAAAAAQQEPATPAG